jgi:ribosomal protein S27AE
MAKLDWRRAKTYRAEWEPQGTDTVEWAEKHRAQVRALKLTCRGCGHQGKARARLDARFVCSKCGSHRIKPALDL